jgi:hypothetical protein
MAEDCHATDRVPIAFARVAFDGDVGLRHRARVVRFDAQSSLAKRGLNPVANSFATGVASDGSDRADRFAAAPPKVDDDSPYYDTVVLDPKSRARRNESLEQMPSETIEPRLFEPPSL